MKQLQVIFITKVLQEILDVLHLLMIVTVLASGDHYFYYFCFSNLAEFPMIPISGRDCAAAASTGGNMPNAARVKPIRLYAVVNARFTLTVRMVR